MKKTLSVFFSVVFMLTTFTGCKEMLNLYDMATEYQDPALDGVYEAIEEGDYDTAYSLLQKADGKQARELKSKFARIIVSEEFNISGSMRRTRYIYDDQGLLLQEVDPDSDDEYEKLYTYDENGNMLSSKTPTSEVIYTYDAAGQLLSETKREGFYTSREHTYVYDNKGNMITETITYANKCMEFRYTYNQKNVLVSMEEWENYERNGEEVYEYDSKGRMTSSVYTFNNGNSWREETFSYDKNGNIIKEELTYSSGVGKTTTYTYNKQGKLVLEAEEQHDGDWTKVAYTYDKDGNCLTKEETSSGDTHDTFTFTYDENGRMSGKEYYGEFLDDRQSTVYTYNDANKEAYFTRTFGSGGVDTKRYYWAIMYYPDGIPENVPVFPENEDMMQVQMDD